MVKEEEASNLRIVRQCRERLRESLIDLVDYVSALVEHASDLVDEVPSVGEMDWGMVAFIVDRCEEVRVADRALHKAERDALHDDVRDHLVRIVRLAREQVPADGVS
jgi:hypothetical protein